MTVLTAPEADTRVALFESNAADAKAAVKAAWAAFSPKQTLAPKLVLPGSVRPGWDEHLSFDYETSTNQRRVLFAEALRSGSRWMVFLGEGTDATFEKRASQVGLVQQSLRPGGFVRETFAGMKAHPLTPERIAVLRDFLQRSMEKAQVPGIGFALIDQGKVVYEGGLGVRELGKPEKVDANTLFMAASNTKGMTTLLLARLADAGKLKWNQPVVEVYPAFKLGDPALTTKVEVKELICACTGMPRQDLEMVMEFAHATPESRMALLGTMKPTSKSGEVFQYSNIMASAAGYVGGHLFDPKAKLGPAYVRAMQEQVFTPLGMRSTTFDLKRVLKGNHASPHGEDADGKTRLASMDFNKCIAPDEPAGGVWTSAHDFARYAQLELDRGMTPEGKRVVSEENLLMRRAPQIALGADGSYGMGLMVDNTWGIPVVHHGGDLLGFHSDFFVLPDSGVGAVILTNGDVGHLLRTPFMRRLLEVLFDGKPEAEINVNAQLTAHAAAVAKERERLLIPADAREAGKLAAHYASAELGELKVDRGNGQTVFDFGEWKSSVASRKNDDGSLSFVTVDPGGAGFELIVTTRKGKRALRILDGQHEYFFEEVGA